MNYLLTLDDAERQAGDAQLAHLRFNVGVDRGEVGCGGRGCGDWGCVCGREHTVPFKVSGKSGSVRVTLIPAPGGVGLAIGDVGKTIMRLAGIDDVWSHTRGQTQTTVNFARATFDALKQLSKVKASEKDLKNLGVCST